MVLRRLPRHYFEVDVQFVVLIYKFTDYRINQRLMEKEHYGSRSLHCAKFPTCVDHSKYRNRVDARMNVVSMILGGEERHNERICE